MKAGLLMLGLVVSASLSACGDDTGEPSPSADAAQTDVTGSRSDAAVTRAMDAGVGALDAAMSIPSVVDASYGADGALLVPQRGTDVDLLFVIDNSGSMATKQAKLIQHVPRLVRVLATGDRCAGLQTCTLTSLTTPERRFEPPRSLHLGVVSTNLGGVDEVPSISLPAIASCLGNGDQGRLQNSLEIATQGVIAMRNEFAGYFTGDEVLAPDPSCALGPVERYQEFEVGELETALVAAQNAFRCVSQLGVRGCPFEQPLEAAWMALAPSRVQGDDYTFLNAVKGQGDAYNDGFLRDNAVLAVVLLSDEDDCSIVDEGKVLFTPPGAPGYDEADLRYGELNLRCGLQPAGSPLIHPSARYRRLLTSLKPNHPERVLFTAITGVPAQAIRDHLPLSQILALPEMRFTPALDSYGSPTGIPVPSCTNADGNELSYPPIRITEVVRDFGAQGVLGSICEDDYGATIDALVDKLSPLL